MDDGWAEGGRLAMALIDAFSRERETRTNWGRCVASPEVQAATSDNTYQIQGAEVVAQGIHTYERTWIGTTGRLVTHLAVVHSRPMRPTWPSYSRKKSDSNQCRDSWLIYIITHFDCLRGRLLCIWPQRNQQKGICSFVTLVEWHSSALSLLYILTIIIDPFESLPLKAMMETAAQRYIYRPFHQG